MESGIPFGYTVWWNEGGSGDAFCWFPWTARALAKKMSKQFPGYPAQAYSNFMMTCDSKPIATYLNGIEQR